MRNFFGQVRETLLRAKFMLEQDLSASEKLAVIQEIRDTLDLVGEAERLLLSPASEENPLIVDTLSTSLADPFDPEPKTQIKEKK